MVKQGQTWSNGAKQDHKWDHTGQNQANLGHRGPNAAIQGQIGPNGTKHGPNRPIWVKRVKWNQTGPNGDQWAITSLFGKPFICCSLPHVTYYLPCDLISAKLLNPICHGLLGPDRFRFCLLEKGVLELCWAATIKPRKIERSVFFLLDHNRSLRTVKKFNCMFPTKKK